MKLMALITDTFREIYAKKVVFGIIGIELMVVAITALIIFSSEQQEEYRKAAKGFVIPADTSAADSARQGAPLMPPAADTSLLGGDDAVPDSLAGPGTSSRTFETTPDETPATIQGTMQGNMLEEMVKGQLAGLAGLIGAAVVFLGIFATAGIVPSMMEKGTIDLLLSKPLHRRTILFGRALGGVLAVAINLAGFVLVLWGLYGLAAGIWHLPFLIGAFSIPMFTFLVLYSAVILLNVVTEGWVLPMSLVYIHMVILANFLHGREQTLFTFISNDALRGFIDGLYYLLPQTTDLLGSAVPMSVYTGGIDTIAPFVQGTLFMVAMLVLATWRFERRDF